MKAITHDRYGSAQVLKFEDIERPAIGDDEVLVQVRAAGVERGVIHLMTGLPYLLRLGFGLRGPRQRVRGREVAGVVEAVGGNVTAFQPGDEVFGVGEGTFAEYARASTAKLARKPANLTFEQAAALSISAITALRGLGTIQLGQKVLITGAGGGVGTFAVQLAKAYGAEVTGVCSTAKVDLVRSIGADHVVDYTREDFAGRRYDLILDIAGNRRLSHLRRSLTRRGTLVLAGGEDGGQIMGGMERSMAAMLLSLFVSQRMRWLLSTESGQDLRVLGAFAEEGKITPVIDKTYPLSQAAEAVAYVADGHARGKVVITV